MLLPSAFPCDNAATAVQPPRPKLQSFTAYQPSQSQAQSKPTKASHIISSCRALQSMLGSALPSPRALLTSTPKKELRNPFGVAFAQSAHKVVKRQPPRGANKRRRDEWDDSDDEKENIQENGYTTPKRQRRIPYDMPLGLCAEDFRALEPPTVIGMPDAPSSPSQQRDSVDHHSDSGYGPSPPLQPHSAEEAWSIDDDRILVETVLEKLQLSKRNWNDCARRIGKDKDSLGRRWKMLVDEGKVGLRRGGRRVRTGLDVGSW